jgi:hypothetical protein
MPRPVAVPPARLVRLGDRDHQKWPAVGLEGSPDDRLAVTKPRLMDQRTPAPAAVSSLAMDDLSAACAELPIGGKPRRPDLSDQFFRAPESRPLFVRIGRNDPPLPPDPSRGVEREQTKLSLGFSPGTHARPAVWLAVQRSAAGRPEVRRPVEPPVRYLMAVHQDPRLTRVRIPYAPPFESPANAGLCRPARRETERANWCRRGLIGARLARGVVRSGAVASAFAPERKQSASRCHLHLPSLTSSGKAT